MTNSLYISTTATGSGKALVALGIIDLILRKTNKVAFFQPIVLDCSEGHRDKDIDLILNYFSDRVSIHPRLFPARCSDIQG